jgi:hypothetical protein
MCAGLKLLGVDIPSGDAMKRSELLEYAERIASQLNALDLDTVRAHIVARSLVEFFSLTILMMCVCVCRNR